MKMQEMEPGVLVLDAGERGIPEKQNEQVQDAARMHFFGNKEGLVEDQGKNGHGFFLGGNSLHSFHIASVRKGIWVVANREMLPEQTRPLARKFLKMFCH